MYKHSGCISGVGAKKNMTVTIFLSHNNTNNNNLVKNKDEYHYLI